MDLEVAMFHPAPSNLGFTIGTFAIKISSRLYGDSVECDTFYGDTIVKLVWRLSGVFMEKLAW